jgi:hypothetical protein
MLPISFNADLNNRQQQHQQQQQQQQLLVLAYSAASPISPTGHHAGAAAGTSTFLKIRWWVGTGLLATPMVAVQLWYASPAPSALLPPDALVHIFVAWAVGGLMAYLSDWYRRCVQLPNKRVETSTCESENVHAASMHMDKTCVYVLVFFPGGGVSGCWVLPPDALVHIFVACAVGGLAYLSDWYRRCVLSMVASSQ